MRVAQGRPPEGIDGRR